MYLIWSLNYKFIYIYICILHKIYWHAGLPLSFTKKNKAPPNCSKWYKTWKKSLKFFPPLWHPSTLSRQKFILTRQNIIFFSKKLSMSFVDVSWHIDLKNEIKKNWEKKINYFPPKGEGGGGGARGKIPPK